MSFNKVTFEILLNSNVKAKLRLWDNWAKDNKSLETNEGIKVMRY